MGEKKAADRRLQSSDEIEIQIEIDSPEEGISDRITGSTGWGMHRAWGMAHRAESRERGRPQAVRVFYLKPQASGLKPFSSDRIDRMG